jgi:membrane protein
MAFFRALAAGWRRDTLDDVAGSVAFFSVLALFPFLLFLVAVASRLVTPEMVRAALAELAQVAPQDVIRIVGGRVASLQHRTTGGLATVGFVGSAWAASSGVVALTHALNRAYNVKESRSFFRVHLRALATTLGAGALVLAATVAAVGVPSIAYRISGPLGLAVVWLRLPFAGAVVAVVLAFIYWWLPNLRSKFRLVTPGSVVAVLLWLAASWAFSLYVQHFGKYEVTYGALGGVIVLMLWIWISSMAVLLGAEINKVLTSDEACAGRAATPAERRLPETTRAEERRRPRLGQLRPRHARPGPVAPLLGLWLLWKRLRSA